MKYTTLLVLICGIGWGQERPLTPKEKAAATVPPQTVTQTLPNVPVALPPDLLIKFLRASKKMSDTDLDKQTAIKQASEEGDKKLKDANQEFQSMVQQQLIPYCTSKGLQLVNADRTFATKIPGVEVYDPICVPKLEVK